MGHKHSKRPKKQKSQKKKSQPEVTEIIELNDNQSDLDIDIENNSTEQITYPIKLKEIMDAVDLIEKSIQVMSSSQMNLYYPTLKDDLHRHWQRLYALPDDDSPLIRSEKIASIERLKNVLKRLNGEVLMSGHGMHNQI